MRSNDSSLELFEGSVHLVWSLTWVILMEVTVERRHGLTGGIVQIGWNIGAMLMTFSAFALRSWHWMQLANAVFSLLLVLYYILVPGLVLVECKINSLSKGYTACTISAFRVPSMVPRKGEV